jgi:hypothetical protein
MFVGSDVDRSTGRSQHREPRLDVIITCILVFARDLYYFKRRYLFCHLLTDSKSVFDVSLQ